MGHMDRADDWTASGVAQFAGGAGPAGGVWLYEFASAKAGFKGTYLFVGIGAGVGWDALKRLARKRLKSPPKRNVVADNFSVSRPDADPLTCILPFSAHDLHLALGSIQTGGASAFLGYELSWITAFRPGINYFTYQFSHGSTFQADVGASAIAAAGWWYYLR